MDFATGAMGSLIPKLGKLLLNEYNLKDTVKDGIRELKEELKSMEAALVKVSSVQLDQLDPQVKIWSDEVRELSYAIEDILDSSMVGLGPTKPDIVGFFEKTKNKITELKVRHKIGNGIKDIKIQVKKVKERYDRYKFDNVVDNLATTRSLDPRLTDLYNKASNLVGIGKAMDEVMKMLSVDDDAPENTLKTVSIVGFGGLGKTTLAKAVHDKIRRAFHHGGIVPVGQNPDMKKVFKDILYELDKDTYKDIAASNMDERQLIDELREFLVGKRYLLVIDDIWGISTWKTIKCALVDSNPGSRVITTTRKHDVAREVGGIYNIKPLSDDDSKGLFNTRIFGDVGSSDDKSVEVSEKFLKKCAGVPLSIITIASLLVGKHVEDWPKVYDSMSFGHEDNELVQNTRKILSFSYYDLPLCLKTCLLHLSIFAEDDWIEKNMLLWKWIAEGFIPDKQGISLFQVAENYLNMLINRSLIRWVEPAHARDSGCRVHDMVLDLIRTLSSQVNFVTIVDTEQNIIPSPSTSSNFHRLALHKRSVQHNTSMEMGHLRSFSASLCTDSWMPPISSFKVLRVLVLEGCHFSRGGYHLKHLVKLVQLRYLGLVNTHVAKLPEGIGYELKFLQTLDVRGSGIKELPSSVGELSKLMCLCADEGTMLMARIGKLTSLEELRLHSMDKSPDFVKELRKLTEIRILEISFSNMDENTHKALVESLSKLLKIQRLQISYGEESKVWSWDEWAPTSEFRELALHCIELPRCPSWMDSSRVLHLSYLWLDMVVVEARDLQILGRLPSLYFLSSYTGDDNCMSYTVGSNEFQNLRHLHTNVVILCGDGALPKLENLGCGVIVGMDVGLVGNMPLLQEIEYFIWDCKKWRKEDVKATKAALRHAAETHPNCPNLEISSWSLDPDEGDYSSEEDSATYCTCISHACGYKDDTVGGQEKAAASQPSP